MKKYKFFETDSNRNIVSSSRGYFTYLTHLPSEFTLDDLKKTNVFSDSKIQRLEKARSGTIIVMTSLGGGGDPRWLSIKCLGESPLAIDDVRTLKEKLEKRLKEIDDEIYKIAQSLIVEKRNLQKQLVDLKNQIRSFDRGD